jgi:uncharacterized lipoprotein YehR (DUF1307 family)
MKHTFKVLIVALIAVIGFSLAACEDTVSGPDNDPFRGTWISTDGYMIFTAENGAWKEFIEGVDVARGTYTYSGNVVTAKITEVNPFIFGRTGPWIKYSDLSNAEKAYLNNGNTDTYMVVVNGNTLTGFGMTFVKH